MSITWYTQVIKAPGLTTGGNKTTFPFVIFCCRLTAAMLLWVYCFPCLCVSGLDYLYKGAAMIPLLSSQSLVLQWPAYAAMHLRRWIKVNITKSNKSSVCRKASARFLPSWSFDWVAQQGPHYFPTSILLASRTRSQLHLASVKVPSEQGL